MVQKSRAFQPLFTTGFKQNSRFFGILLHHQRIQPISPPRKNRSQKFPAFTRPDFIALGHGLVFFGYQMGDLAENLLHEFLGPLEMVVKSKGNHGNSPKISREFLVKHGETLIYYNLAIFSRKCSRCSLTASDFGLWVT